MDNNVNASNKSSVNGNGNSKPSAAQVQNGGSVAELENRILELESKIKELALTIDTVEDEKLEIENKWKKALADYQNLEKGIENRIQIKSVSLKKDLAAGLMEVVTDVQYMKKAKDDLGELSDAVSAWVNGTYGAFEKLEKVLDRLGIELLQVKKGDKFDSSVHEAIAVLPEGGKNDEIIEVVQPGFKIDGVIVQNPKVVVCKKG